MEWSSVYLLLIVLTQFVLIVLLAYAWRFRFARGALSFATLVYAAGGWTFLVGVMALVPPESALTWLNIKYLFIAFLPVPVFLFVLEFTGRERLVRPPLIAALCVVPALTQVFVWTNGANHLMLRSVQFAKASELTYLSQVTFGPWYWVHTLFGYFLVMTSAVLVISAMIRGGALVRRQGIPILLGLLLPLVSNVLLVTRIAPVQIDPMPFGLAMTALLFGWAALRHHLLDLVPIARGTLIDAVRDGMLALDSEGRIVDMNRTMAELAGLPRASYAGRPATKVFSAHREILALLGDAHELVGKENVHEIKLGDREFEVDFIALETSGRTRSGMLLVLHDQTLRKRMEWEREALIGELRETLKQVKTLKGMLPICANCKKVRDDTGYWHQVDVYIRNHSEAEITHGICPECHEQLYPEYSKPPPGRGEASG